MSKKEDKDEKATPDEDAPKPSKKKKIIILAIAVLLLGGAGVAAKTMFFGSKKAAVVVAPLPGKVTALDAVTVNLANGHYLKIKLALQATVDVVEDLDGSHALDIAIDQLSNQDMAVFSSKAGRNKAKAELLDAVEKAYKGEVMDIYFTEFVIQ